MSVDDKRQYHTGLERSQIGNAEFAILPGDPGRVPELAKALDKNARAIHMHREYNSWMVIVDSVPVLVCSTGIGGPSTAIAVEELAQLGVKNFIRVGTTGSIQKHIEFGDIVISLAAVRLDGASTHYAPIEYPAVASLWLTNALVNAAEKLKIPFHVGITASSDTFWPGQERYDNYSGYVLRRFQGSVEEWRKLNVTNFEMEAATLFTMCSAFGLSAACLCGVIAKRTESEEVNLEAYAVAFSRLAKIIRGAIVNHPDYP